MKVHQPSTTTRSESTPAFGDRYKFTGRELDPDTGLQYNRARQYRAATASTASTAQARNTDRASATSGPDMSGLSIANASARPRRVQLKPECLAQPRVPLVGDVQSAAPSPAPDPPELDHAFRERSAERAGEMMTLLAPVDAVAHQRPPLAT